MITTHRPFTWMVNFPGSNHVHVNVGHTAKQVFACINRSSMVPIFPESPFSIFTLVELLCGAPCN